MYVGMHVLELQIMYVHFVVGIGGVVKWGQQNFDI